MQFSDAGGAEAWGLCGFGGVSRSTLCHLWGKATLRHEAPRADLAQLEMMMDSIVHEKAYHPEEKRA